MLPTKLALCTAVTESCLVSQMLVMVTQRYWKEASDKAAASDKKPQK